VTKVLTKKGLFVQVLFGACLIICTAIPPLSLAENMKNQPIEQECVILLHGLGRTRFSMNKIAHHLKDAGYRVVNQGYPSTNADIETLARVNIGKALADPECKSAEKIHFVTHSLGGILVRQYIQNHTIPNIGRIVMLAPPNKGSEVADALKNNFFYKWIMGQAGQQLGTDVKSIPNTLKPVDMDLGIITGNKNGSPWFSSLIPGDDDGKVSVESAKLKGMDDFLVVACGHTFIMRDPDVIDQIAFYLQHGRFKKEN
jgi:triacylglycerol lipase